MFEEKNKILFVLFQYQIKPAETKSYSYSLQFKVYRLQFTGYSLQFKVYRVQFVV